MLMPTLEAAYLEILPSSKQNLSVLLKSALADAGSSNLPCYQL